MNTVQCPNCQKLVPWSDEFPYRPFCSKRCKIIDLGAWADGSYAIPSTKPFDEDLEDFAPDTQELPPTED